MSGNNSSYTHWKPNVSLDIIAAGGGASGYGNVLKTSAPSQPISMATLTAIPSHGEYLVTHPSYGDYIYMYNVLRSRLSTANLIVSDSHFVFVCVCV